MVGHKCLTFIDILMIFPFKVLKNSLQSVLVKVSILNMHNKHEILYVYRILNCHQQHHYPCLLAIPLRLHHNCRKMVYD